MSDRIGGLSANLTGNVAAQTQMADRAVKTGEAFGQALEIQFSRHATERIAQRQIQLDSNDLEKISAATDKAADRGSKDALVLLRDLGLVVNIKNRKVLTAIDAENMQNHVFTNIDSTVIIRD